jgi:hypothetical protein
MKCLVPASGNGETSLVVLLAILFVATAAAQTSRVSDKEALPVLQKCFQCHGEALQMSKLDLHTLDGMLKGGENGPALVPGDANASLIYKRVAGLQQPIMPMRPLSNRRTRRMGEAAGKGAKGPTPKSSGNHHFEGLDQPGRPVGQWRSDQAGEGSVRFRVR